MARVVTRSFKHGLHIVVTVVEHASDVAPERISRLSTHQLQIFPVKYEYLRSLQLCEVQGMFEKHKQPLVSLKMSLSSATNGLPKENIEILGMTGEVNSQRLKQRNKYFFHISNN